MPGVRRLRDPRMSEHILTRKHKHHTHPHAAFGWRIQSIYHHLLQYTQPLGCRREAPSTRHASASRAQYAAVRAECGNRRAQFE